MLFPVAQVLARATRRRRTRQSADRPLRAVRVPAAVLASVYVLSVLTHGLGGDGMLATLAVGGKWLLLVGLTGLLVLRAVVVREDRVVWLLFAAAVGSWFTAGTALFVLTATVYAYQVAHETYVFGGPLDVGWGLAFLCYGLAACQAPRPRRPEQLRGVRALVVPGLCAVGALVLLLWGYLEEGDPLAGGLAFCAVVAALARTALTFREVRSLADSRLQARTDELTGSPTAGRSSSPS